MTKPHLGPHGDYEGLESGGKWVAGTSADGRWEIIGRARYDRDPWAWFVVWELRDTDRNKCVKTFSGNTHDETTVQEVKFSPNGQRVVALNVSRKVLKSVNLNKLSQFER